MEFAVRRATEADRPGLAALIGEMIPGCDADARIRWMYEANPAGSAMTWLATAPGGELAGCTSLFPSDLWLDGTTVHAALGGDGFVRPAFRAAGVAVMLHEAVRRAMAEHDLGCIYSAPGARDLASLRHSGAREIGQVARWVRPIPGRGRVRSLWRPHGRARLEPMAVLDERADVLWEAARTALRLAAVRDATFYTWRFLDAPAPRESPFVIVDRGRPLGICALETIDAGTTVRIVDLMALPEAWHACLRAIVRHAIDTTQAERVDLELMAVDGRRRHLWRSGFVERETRPFVVMIAKDGDRRYLDPCRWFHCGAGADLETLE